MQLHSLCSLLLPLTLLCPLTSAHAGESHGPEITDPATTPSPSSSDSGVNKTMALAWGLNALAMVGGAIGGSVPLFAHPYDRIHAKDPSKRTAFEILALGVLADIRGPKFISAALSFAAGVLLYGALALMIPGSIQLVRPVLGVHSNLVIFSLWMAGCLAFALLRLATDSIDSSASDSESPAVACPCHGPSGTEPAPCCEPPKSPSVSALNTKSLRRFNIMTMVAVAAHKIPEGIVSFLSTIASPHFGVVLAFAILIHNIPESIAISVPLFKTSGSYALAFWLPVACTSFQLVGAAIGYAVWNGAGFSQLAEGCVYAPIAGMLCFIAVRGLWPFAMVVERDVGSAAGKWTGVWFLVGVAVMMLSGAMFSYAY